MGVSQTLPRNGSDRRPLKTCIDRSAYISRPDLLTEVVFVVRVGAASSTNR